MIDEVHRITGHAEVMRHYADTGGRPWTRGMTEALLDDHEVHATIVGGQLVAIAWVGLDDWLDGLPPTPGLNWYTHPKCTGQGYATALAKSLVKSGMVACVAEGNEASAAVARKIGMQWEAALPYVVSPSLTFTFNVWRARDD